MTLVTNPKDSGFQPTAPAPQATDIVNLGGHPYHWGFVHGDTVPGFRSAGAPSVVAAGAIQNGTMTPANYVSVGLSGFNNLPTGPNTFLSPGFLSNSFFGSNDQPVPAVPRGYDTTAFATGGEVGPGGVNLDLANASQPSAPAAPMMPNGDVEAQTTSTLGSNPQAAAQMRAAVMEAMQSGELTQQELNQIGQLVRAALRKPELYPQLRQYALSNGLGESGDIPEQFDQGFLSLLLMVVQSVESSDASAPNTGMANSQDNNGVMPKKSSSPDGKVPITAHEGEFVLHAGAVRALGLDRLRALNDKYDRDGNQVPKETKAG